MDNITKYVETLEQRRKEQNIDNELSKSNLLKNSIENRIKELQAKSREIPTIIPKDNSTIVKRVSIGTPIIKIDLKKVKEAIVQASKYEIRNKELIKIKESEDLKKYLQDRFGKGFNSQKLLIVLKSFIHKQSMDFKFLNLDIFYLFRDSFEDNKYFIETFICKYNFDITLLNLIDTEENRVLLN